MADKIHVVSTDFVPGYEVTEAKGMVWGTTVRARFVGRDIIAVIRILLGGEVKEYTNMVNAARMEALKRMLKNAKRLDADAVIGARIDSTSQIVPGAVELFSYGTAVKLKKKRGRKK